MTATSLLDCRFRSSSLCPYVRERVGVMGRRVSVKNVGWVEERNPALASHIAGLRSLTQPTWALSRKGREDRNKPALLVSQRINRREVSRFARGQDTKHHAHQR